MGGKKDVVARLVSKKARSRIVRSCSSSEEDSLDKDDKVEEEEYVESFESIEEEAGRCKHGPPTDYPCHLCCHQKWVSARRLDQPFTDRGKGKGQVFGISGSEQVSGDVQARSKEKRREHSEESRGDCADILFDGITVGPKTKKANHGQYIGEKQAKGCYGFNLPPGVTITSHLKATHKEVPKKTKGNGVTITSLSNEQELREIVKKTNWAEVFRISGVSLHGKPEPPVSGEEEVIIEDEVKSGKREEWECTFCTFLNSEEAGISSRCQMCQ